MNQYELDSVTPGAGNDSKLWIRFFVDAEQDLEESEQAGRPIFSEKEFIEIRIPGDKDEIRVMYPCVSRSRTPVLTLDL